MTCSQTPLVWLACEESVKASLRRWDPARVMRRSMLGAELGGKLGGQLPWNVRWFGAILEEKEGQQSWSTASGKEGTWEEAGKLKVDLDHVRAVILALYMGFGTVAIVLFLLKEDKSACFCPYICVWGTGLSTLFLLKWGTPLPPQVFGFDEWWVVDEGTWEPI